MSTPGDLFDALGHEARARLSGGGSATRSPDVRVYHGRNIDELIPRIESELGADALIVRRRDGLTGGVLGFFQHAFVEIEAMPGRPGIDVYDEQEPAAPEALPTLELGSASEIPPGAQLLPAAPEAAPPPDYAPPGQAPGAYPPAAYRPGAYTPAAHTPAAYTPAAYTPAAHTPAAHTPAAYTPAAHTPKAYPPAAYTPKAYTPKAYPPGAHTPAAYTPAGAYPPGAYTPGPYPQDAYPPAGPPGGQYTPPQAAPQPVAPQEQAQAGTAPDSATAGPYPSPPNPSPQPYVPSFQSAYPSAARPPLPSQPASAAGAYLTPHMAALAREGPPPPLRPSPEPPPVGVDFQELLGRQPSRPTGRSAPPIPRLTPPAAERDLLGESRAGGARARTPPERRTVVAGSHGLARVGVERSLRRSGISDEFARELIDIAGAHTVALSPRAGLAQAVCATLAQRIPVLPPPPAKGAAIVLVGAGGSGKTTCCAALLNAYRASSTLPACYTTLTRQREGGELLMILSPEIVTPTRATTTPALRALGRARSEGVAILDTPSLSPAEKGPIRDLGRLLEEIKPERIVVALPATLGAAPAGQLLAALAPLGADSLAVTHADETDQLGVAVEAACRYGLAPEYILRREHAPGWRLHRIDPTDLAARIMQ